MCTDRKGTTCINSAGHRCVCLHWSVCAQNLPEEMRAAKQAQLDSLEKKASKQDVVKKVQHVAAKYHKIKFFEKRKVDRRIKRVEHALQRRDGGGEAAESSSSSSSEEENDDDDDDDDDDDEAQAAQAIDKLSVKELQKELVKWKADLEYIAVCMGIFFNHTQVVWVGRQRGGVFVYVSDEHFLDINL